MLGFIETGLVLLILIWIGFDAANVFFKARISSELMENPTPYEALTTDYAKTLLILGDSTGVGTGASLPEDTIAARVAAHIGATYVENQAKNGAAVEDLSTQIQHLRLTHYDVILVQIGGNDIIAYRSAQKSAQKLDAILGTLPDAGKVIVLSAGNVGGATIVPHLLRPFYTWKNLSFHKAFTKVVEARGMTYVNLYMKPSTDPFIKDPDRYLAPDGLHPSSEGYGLWFEVVKKAL